MYMSLEFLICRPVVMIYKYLTHISWKTSHFFSIGGTLGMGNGASDLLLIKRLDVEIFWVDKILI